MLQEASEADALWGLALWYRLTAESLPNATACKKAGLFPFLLGWFAATPRTRIEAIDIAIAPEASSGVADSVDVQVKSARASTDARQPAASSHRHSGTLAAAVDGGEEAQHSRKSLFGAAHVRVAPTPRVLVRLAALMQVRRFVVTFVAAAVCRWAHPLLQCLRYAGDSFDGDLMSMTQSC